MKSIFRKIVSFFRKLFNKKTTIPAPHEFGKGTQWWYGRVNYWNNDQNLLDKEVKLMRSVGVAGYIIELAAWRGNGNSTWTLSPTSDKYKKQIAETRKIYKHLHKLCIENGLWLFVGVVNDNALSNKHGNKAANPKNFYKYPANDLLSIVLEDGNQNVVVQPISELEKNRVSNHPGPAWQRNAVAKLSANGFLTCNNDGYGRPGGTAGMNFMAWHPNKVSHLPSKASKSLTFIVSDTGGIISELNGGTNCDKVDANCKPSKIKEWRAKCNGYAVCGYYDYKRKSFNEAAIKAMAGK